MQFTRLPRCKICFDKWHIVFISSDAFNIKKNRWYKSTAYSVSDHISPMCHDDIIKWKHFPRHLPFVRGIHRSPVNPPHKGQWRGALMFSYICAWTNSWANSKDAGYLRRYREHYDVTVMARLADSLHERLVFRKAFPSYAIMIYENTEGWLQGYTPKTTSVWRIKVLVTI